MSLKLITSIFGTTRGAGLEGARGSDGFLAISGAGACLGLPGAFTAFLWGKCFFGESMFTRISNASKVAFVKLVNHLEIFDFDMVDCQISTSHLINFGAKEVSRKRFMEELERSLRKPTPKGKWSF